ncbi:MAG: glycosyltransferase family 4 protein [Sphingomonadales bacterium]
MHGMAEPADGRAIMIQYGARRMYAVPAALAREGRLEAFYTDFCVTPAIKPLVGMLPRSLGRAASVLTRRTPPPEVLPRTRSFPSWTRDVGRALKSPGPAQRARAMQDAHERAGRRFLRAGFGGATHVLSIFGEGRGLLEAARDRGLDVVIDVNIALSTERILLDEARRHPGWGQAIYFGEALEAERGFRRPSEFIIDVATRLMCPSEFVRDDLVRNYGVPAENTRLVPYSVHESWFALENRPEPGRVLFAGSPDLRKGIHILAEAARILRGRGRDYRFIVVGSASDAVRGRPETRELTFLGQLPSAQLRAELAKADLFCFPSLAEGSAAATYEALAAAVPVVTTRAAGSVVVDGESGLLVPEGDPAALADAVERVVEDRAFRNSLSVAARHRARDHDWGSFQRRLVSAVFEKDRSATGLTAGSGVRA